MFRKLICRLVSRAINDQNSGRYENDYNRPPKYTECTPKLRSNDLDINTDNTTNITFRLINANGGKIVQSIRWDPKTDRNVSNLYIIPEELELMDEVGKIITMEGLRG